MNKNKKAIFSSFDFYQKNGKVNRESYYSFSFKNFFWLFSLFLRVRFAFVLIARILFARDCFKLFLLWIMKSSGFTPRRRRSPCLTPCTYLSTFTWYAVLWLEVGGRWVASIRNNYLITAFVEWLERALYI